MSILPSEEIIKFSFNLPPQAFDSMKTDMRLFGERTRIALKTDLKGRLDEKRENHQVVTLLIKLLEGVEDYKLTIYQNFDEYITDTKNFNSDRNIAAFWQFMNAFLLNLVVLPEHVDSVLLEKPVQDILSPYFEEIGYLVEFYIHSQFSSWFPHYTVTVAQLISRQHINETCFGYPLSYTLEHIRTLKPSIIFGVSSFFDQKAIKIRIDHSTADASFHPSLNGLMNEEKKFIEAVTQKPYELTVLNHILFHERMHYLFRLIKKEAYSQSAEDHAFVFNYLMLSEVWARLTSLFLSNGALIFELNSLLGIKDTGDPVYIATYMFLSSNTSIFLVFNDSSISLNEAILKIRILAFESLQRTANWMNVNFRHPSERNWDDLVTLLKQEYARDESSNPQLHYIYRPETGL